VLLLELHVLAHTYFGFSIEMRFIQWWKKKTSYLFKKFNIPFLVAVSYYNRFKFSFFFFRVVFNNLFISSKSVLANLSNGIHYFVEILSLNLYFGKHNIQEIEGRKSFRFLFFWRFLTWKDLFSFYINIMLNNIFLCWYSEFVLYYIMLYFFFGT
jgi:hypothetical protein